MDMKGVEKAHAMMDELLLRCGTDAPTAIIARWTI